MPFLLEFAAFCQDDMCEKEYLTKRQPFPE
jgi:hypothetical protein